MAKMPMIFFFHYKSFFFLRLTQLSFLFAVFLCFCGFRAALSPVRCERLGAVKVKVRCGGRWRQMRYAKGGDCVANVWITYGSS